jgi:sn-glycerol 3-phosphate transport system ATP-binding protein
MPDLVLEQVRKTWGQYVAVDGVSFTASQGKFVSILGPSGCGKSTTLRLVAGLEELTSGKISSGDKTISNLPPTQRNLSMVFQSYALFPHLTVKENILFGLKVRKVDRNEQKKRLDRAIEILGVSALLDRKPNQLSGGQQQRVALGRALVAQAPLCLMDEPLSNLDAKLRNEMRVEIRRIQQELGMTMLFVTHDQSEAMSMSDRVILMDRGRIAQDGTPAELYENPSSVFVAKFIGSPPMNVIKSDAARWEELSTHPTLNSIHGENQYALFGIRPEHVSIVAEGLPAQVVSTSYFGSESIVCCSSGGNDILIRLQERDVYEPGSMIKLHLDPEKIIKFDPETGNKLSS